jgi:hypothetical protein
MQAIVAIRTGRKAAKMVPIDDAMAVWVFAPENP